MKKSLLDSTFPLENLRTDYTNLSQDEFIVYCGFKRATYFRWQAGTPIRLTPDQVIKTCIVCGISFRQFFELLGFDTKKVPD